MNKLAHSVTRVLPRLTHSVYLQTTGTPHRLTHHHFAHTTQCLSILRTSELADEFSDRRAVVRQVVLEQHHLAAVLETHAMRDREHVRADAVHRVEAGAYIT